jgi:hypothetical protein
MGSQNEKQEEARQMKKPVLTCPVCGSRLPVDADNQCEVENCKLEFVVMLYGEQLCLQHFNDKLEGNKETLATSTFFTIKEDLREDTSD